MSMEGKFKDLAQEGLHQLNPTDGGATVERSQKTREDEDTVKEAAFEKEILEAKKQEEVALEAIYNLYEPIDSPEKKNTLIEEFIDVLDTIGAESGHATRSFEYAYQKGAEPAPNPLTSKVRELVATFGYDRIRHAVLEYQMINKADWNSPRDRIDEN
jgi:hypothetical protein